MNKRETLIEQYDDAVFALLMDEYAENSGAELLRQYQEALDTGLVPEIPEELDRRCTEAIDTEFRSRRWKAWLKYICRGLVRLVFALFYLVRLLVRTAWDIWQEHQTRSKSAHAPAELNATNEDDPPIFLTP